MSSSRFRRDHAHSTDDPAMSDFDFKFKPRALRQCINGVFKGTPTTAPCLGETERAVITTEERTMYREDMKTEVRTFHDCLCSLHHYPDNCMFSLNIIQRNQTVLEGCFDKEEYNTPFTHPAITDNNFACNIRKGKRIRCRLVEVPVIPKETRFQHVLNCISSSLNLMKCPVKTTAGALLTTTPAQTASTPPQAQLMILIMALVISLLLGVLGTWLGIFCWRKRRRKNRPLPPLMTRPEHASLPNLYDDEYTEDHIYDIVKPDDSPTSHPVPDLLNRVPSLPPITNRTPKSRVHVEADKSKAAFNKTEMYEPLLRGHSTSNDRHSTDPKTPVPADDMSGNDYLPLLPDRTSREIPPSGAPKRVHPYDSVNESEVGIEAQDESVTTPKVIDSPSHSTNKPSGNDYFILEPSAVKVGKETGNRSDEHDLRTDNQLENNSGRNSLPDRVVCSPNDSGYIVSPSEKNPEMNADVALDSETKTDVDFDRDSDGYEIPVSAETPFDIASSFRNKTPHVVGEEKEDVFSVRL